MNHKKITKSYMVADFFCLRVHVKGIQHHIRSEGVFLLENSKHNVFLKYIWITQFTSLKVPPTQNYVYVYEALSIVSSFELVCA